MSMIGRLNFALQEQAEELGFETTQEALDNGYKVNYADMLLVKEAETDEDLERELAEAEWEKEKLDKRIEELKNKLNERK